MYEMNWIDFIIIILAAFRITRLIVFDEITSFIRNPFLAVIEKEDETGGKELVIEIKGRGLRRFIGKLLSCYWCTGFWVSLGVVCAYYILPDSFPVLIVLAVAGAAGIIESKI